MRICVRVRVCLYMCASVCAEYSGRGHVSERTDSFAFGVMAIELMTGLHPILARELIDDHEFAELPAAIQQLHDGTIAEPTLAGVTSASKSKCKWPTEPLGQMALIAAKCSRLQAKRRSTIREVLPELSEAYASGQRAALPAPAAV